jgi:dTDP-4-amino-4,6-dideoxy-D-galactose acyltransferase
MKAIHKDWDSDFFGREILELEFDEDNQQDISSLLIQHPKAMWQCRTDIKNFEIVNSLLSQGFRWVSNTVRFENYSLGDLYDERLRLADSNDLKSIRSFLPGLYSSSRYCCPDFFSNDEADRFYATWVDKAYLGTFDDELLVYHNDNHLAGFVSIKYSSQHAKIGLVGIHPSFMGKGIGKNMLHAIQTRCVSKGVNSISVQTQLENISAIGLYSRVGFKVVGIDSWFYKKGN